MDLYVDGERCRDILDVQVSTPRMAYPVTDSLGRGKSQRLGPAGFSINMQGPAGRLPGWLDGQPHDVAVVTNGHRLPVRVPLDKVDEDEGRWYGFGALTESVTVPRWEAA